MKAISAFGLLIGLVVGFSTPALATDARQAIRLCEANPNCNFNVDDDGGVTLVVDDKVVSCPRKGECTCICGKQAGSQGVLGILSIKRAGKNAVAQ